VGARAAASSASIFPLRKPAVRDWKRSLWGLWDVERLVQHLKVHGEGPHLFLGRSRVDGFLLCALALHVW